MGPGRGAQRRRFGEPGLSSAASNSIGRFSVAPHAMSLRGQRPGADAETTAAQSPAPQRGSQAEPAPMAPPAPGSDADPASCDVTGERHRPAGGGDRKRAAPGGLSATARPATPLLRKWNDLGGERGRRATSGRPPPPPPPLLGSHPPTPWLSRRGGPLGFRTCAAWAWGRGELGGDSGRQPGSGDSPVGNLVLGDSCPQAKRG